MSIRYVGYFAEGTGYGKAAREHLLAMASSGVDVGARSVLLTHDGPALVPPDPRAYPEVARLSGHAPPYRAVVVHTPPDVFPCVREDGYVNIGVAAWETDELPRAWHAPVRAMDEVWVPSRFCRDAFAKVTDRPIAVIPHPVRAPSPRARAFPGVPDDLFVFVAIFEWSDRKNPEALVRAFRRAFAGRRDVALLLKVGLRFGGDGETLLRALRRLISPWPWRSPPIYLLEQTDTSPEVVAQLHARADAYVSLHRAEGFGLCMAEAMAAGKPVVATRYSGNLEFMDDDSAFLVDFDRVPIRQGLGKIAYFDPWMHWAEPRLDDAVEKLRACVDSPSARAQKAARGQARVLRDLSPAAIGARMRARLEQLGVTTPSSLPAQLLPVA